MLDLTPPRPARRIAGCTALCLAVLLGGARPGWAQQAPTQDYLNFLEQSSMLYQADQEADKISGMGIQWQEDFSKPKPQDLVQLASVWLLYYPGSVIPKPGASVIGTWADPQFWATNHAIGITLLHTNPTERAGGIAGQQFTPTIDGYFDRIGLDTAPELGTDAEYKQLVANAQQQGAIVAGDLSPLETGLGPDFRLAEMGYKDYPGLYDMVEIAQQDWGLLPSISDPWGRDLVSKAAAVELKNKGYIPGLINSADANPDAPNWSGWSATPAVVGADGVTRRWVYMHVFKPEEPTLNWTDPSFAAQRAQLGDLGRNIVDRGIQVFRLDADTFLGLEPQPGSSQASVYLTAQATLSTQDIAFGARKLGGFTYHEFAAPLAQLKQFAPNGPDMAYDFFTRAETLYALIGGDALPLRLGHHFLLDQGVSAGTLIHDMQNHDEITFQLFELGAHDDFQFEGQTLNGKSLKKQILDTMRTHVAGDAAPYNLLYRPAQDGVATTFAGFIAPALGVKDPYHATPDQVALIRQGHLLVAYSNAMIPGVFSISAWDLVGALPIPLSSINPALTAGGDFRWVNRGALDLLDSNPTVTASPVFGLPKAQMLYGPVTTQLNDPNSFVSQLTRMLAARKQYRIAEAQILSVPSVGNRSVCVLVMRLPDSQNLAITALQYGRNKTTINIDLAHAAAGISAGSVAGQQVTDIVANQSAGKVSSNGVLTVSLDGLTGHTFVIQTK